MSHLTDMSITRVSLVDKGANAKRIAVLKRDEEASMSEQVAAAIAKVDGDEHAKAGIAGWLRKAADALLGRPDPVVKTATFAEVVAGQELTDALSDSFYTLQDVLWSAIYAYDENGQSLSIEAKTALVAQDLDEFKTYLLGQMADVTVAKGDQGSPDQRRLGAIVRKVGAKVSAARLERLNAAAEALNSVLAEVDQDTEKRAEPEEEIMTPDELTAAITKANEPLIARIERLEKPEDAGAAAATATEETADELTLEGVAKAVIAVQESVDALAKARGERTSADGQEGAEAIKKSKWAGVF